MPENNRYPMAVTLLLADCATSVCIVWNAKQRLFPIRWIYSVSLFQREITLFPLSVPHDFLEDLPGQSLHEIIHVVLSVYYTFCIPGRTLDL